jgi:hypothetical protein
LSTPATLFLLGSGLVGLAGLRRKFKKIRIKTKSVKKQVKVRICGIISIGEIYNTAAVSKTFA